MAGTSACRGARPRLETHNLALTHQPLHFARRVACCECRDGDQATPAGGSLGASLGLPNV